MLLFFVALFGTSNIDFCCCGTTVHLAFGSFVVFCLLELPAVSDYLTLFPLDTDYPSFLVVALIPFTAKFGSFGYCSNLYDC